MIRKLDNNKKKNRRTKKKNFTFSLNECRMIDLDTLITNMSIPFHRFPEPIVSQLPKASLFISKDCNQFNSGSFLIRNTPWSMYCLNQINLSYTQLHLQQHPWCEQEGLIRYYRMNSTWHHYMIETPDTLFNMYPEESPCLKLRYWQPGDFVLHFAGMMHGVQNLPLFVRKYHETYAMSHSPDVHFHEERYVQQIQQWFHVLY
ncbi:hypothetical protein HMI55_007146 [Coelomomyces lativittatus]|nr:hypothetical protein HMI56_001878 [Coelomomyces lativittatus]KAJ1517418.1 hypothetical protein HMI55_007146 [Coelomomyces lativittatus]